MKEAPSILLADDHPIVLRGLTVLLSNFRIVATCLDGTEAVECLRELEPDLAVLDISMPGLSGIEVLRIIESEGLRTRIVFLTASVKDETATVAFSAGAWGIVLKEAAASELEECLLRVLAGEQCPPSEMVRSALDQERAGPCSRGHIQNFLTPREREIARLVAAGMSNKQIARAAGIAEGTVKMHLYNIYQKLGVTNRAALAVLANRLWCS